MATRFAGRGGEPATKGAKPGLLAVGLLLVPSPALGQAPAPPAPDPARLEYTRAAEIAAACPPEVFFRNAVAGHLGGGDPFTADAPKRIKVSLRRRSGAFAARLELFDEAGDRVGDPEDRVDRNCDSLVEEAARHVANAWLVPLVLVRPAPAPLPAPAPVRRSPGSPVTATPAVALVTPPPRIPKPGVFDGSAGYVRALLLGLTAAGMTAGITLQMVAGSRLAGAREVLGSLVQRTGATPCYRTSPALTASCRQLGDLLAQHDNLAASAIALFVAAGVTGGSAAIWIMSTPGTPGAPSVRVEPAAPPGSLAGLTLEGLW